MSAVERNCRDAQEIAITASASTSGGIPMSSYAGGILMLDTTSTGSAMILNWFVKESVGGATAYQLRDAAGNAITRVCGQAQAVEIPTEAFAAKWLIPVISTSGTASGRFTLKG